LASTVEKRYRKLPVVCLAAGMPIAMEKFEFRVNKPIDLTSLQIEGERIVLNSIHERYSSEIFKEFSDDVTQYMGPKSAETIEDTIFFINESINGMKAGHDLNLVITKKENGEFLGCCGLHGKGNPRTPELGIWIKKDAHGNKYGQEAIRTLAMWGVLNIDFDFLVYPVDRANLASRKIPESLGGVVFHEQQVSTVRGISLDQVFYKLSPEVLKKYLGL
jgi:RimJ/RimL family protein N-acetyltransferase